MLLERGFDRLHGMLSRITARQAIAMPSNLIDSFERAATGDYGVAEAPIDAASAEKSASAQQSKAAPAPAAKGKYSQPAGPLSAQPETQHDDPHDLQGDAPQARAGKPYTP